jgi:hypothetical protein
VVNSCFLGIMEIKKEDLALLSRFFGSEAIRQVSIEYERRIFSKIKFYVVLEDGSEKCLRVYITKNKILIF